MPQLFRNTSRRVDYDVLVYRRQRETLWRFVNAGLVTSMAEAVRAAVMWWYMAGCPHLIRLAGSSPYHRIEVHFSEIMFKRMRKSAREHVRRRRPMPLFVRMVLDTFFEHWQREFVS